MGSFSLLAEGWTSLLVVGGASLVATVDGSLILLVLFCSLSSFCGMTNYTVTHTHSANVTEYHNSVTVENFYEVNEWLTFSLVTFPILQSLQSIHP